MGVQDLIFTPFYFLVLLGLAYMVRPMLTDNKTRPYFIPGLLMKFIGAIALGLIYQFYYGGGDTFTFHTHGSRWIWQAFVDNPINGLKMLFEPGGLYSGEIFKYSSRIWLYRDQASYFVIKVAAFFDLFTFGTYSSTALFFASFAFSGLWVLFIAFQKLFPLQTKKIAIACLFVPSVVFWGSGILKDSLTLGALCWMCYLMFEIVIWRKKMVANMVGVIFFGWILMSIKIYILLCFLVAASIYLYLQFSSKIKSLYFKVVMTPLLVTLFIGGGYLILNKIAQKDARYDLENIAQTAMTTAYDIRYGWGARGGENSGYTLGELNGGFGSLMALAPKGIIVTLFRPWLWEVKNPLMLMASLESSIFMGISMYLLFSIKLKRLWSIIQDPVVLFCLTFSLLFAFAVGVSTYNFGTLMRYKIPVIPFYSIFLVLLTNRNRPKDSPKLQVSK